MLMTLSLLTASSSSDIVLYTQKLKLCMCGTVKAQFLS